MGVRNTLVIDQVDNINGLDVHLTLFRDAWKYKFQHYTETSVIMDRIFGEGSTGIHVTLEAGAAQEPHCYRGGPNFGRTPAEKATLQQSLDNCLRVYEARIEQLKRDYSAFDFPASNDPLERLFSEPRDAFEEIARMATEKHGSAKTKLRVVYPPQPDAALMWSGASVHPLQQLQNTFQRLVRDATRGLPDEKAREEEGAQLGNYYFFRSTTPKLMGLPKDADPDVEEQLANAEKALQTLKFDLEKMAPREARLRLYSVLMSVVMLRSLFPEQKLQIPALTEMDNHLLDLDAEINGLGKSPPAGQGKSPPTADLKGIHGRLEKALKQVGTALSGFCCIQNFHVIEPFYLFRLLVKFQVAAELPVEADTRRDVSTTVTGLLHNSPVHQRWLFTWLRDKLVELDQALLRACPEKGPPTADWPDGEPAVVFFLKGGRAAKYLQKTPEDGENDWDTNIVINPLLPAADWYRNFLRVHNAVLLFMQRAKIDFFIEAYKNADSFNLAIDEYIAKAAKPGSPPKSSPPPAPPTLDELITDEDDALNALADKLAGQAGDITESENCKAELIDIGLPRRDTIEAFEQWFNVCPRIIRPLAPADNIPIPGHLYYIAEYVMMIREALMDKSMSPHKTPKRVIRLLEVLEMNDPEFQERIDEEKHHIPDGALALSWPALVGQTEPVQRMLTILLKQFFEAYDLAQEPGLAEQFDRTFAADLGNMQAKVTYPQRYQDELAKEIKKGLKYEARHTALAEAIAYAQWISQAIDDHLRKDRAQFVMKKETRTILTNFVKAIYTASVFAESDGLEVQFAVAGAFAAMLHAEYAEFERMEDLDPVTRIDLKIYCLDDAKPAIVLELIMPLIDRFKESMKLNLGVAKPNEETVCLTWPEDMQFPNFTYKPVMIRITVEKRVEDWPQLSFIKGLPVLGLRDLVWESKKHAGRVEETFTQRGLRKSIDALVDILTRFENPGAGPPWRAGSPPRGRGTSPPKWKGSGGSDRFGSASSGRPVAPRRPGYSPPPIVAPCGHCPGGVTNTGNTCYLNSSLQVLAALDYNLRPARPASPPRPATPDAVIDAIASIRRGNGVDRTTAVRLKHAVMPFIGRAAWAQRMVEQDAEEFLRELLEAAGCDKVAITHTVNAGVPNLETYHFIPLSFPAGAGAVTLQAMMDYFLVEVEGGRRHDRAFAFGYPDILGLHLKRYTDPHHKIDRAVQAPLQWATPDGSNYRLKAFIEHIGASTNTGHYVAYVQVHDRWHRISDSSVDCNVDVRGAVQRAYMLFYRKQ